MDALIDPVETREILSFALEVAHAGQAFPHVNLAALPYL
jgi:hypothetical protein